MKFLHTCIALIAILVIQLVFPSLLAPLVAISSEECLSNTVFYVYGSTQCPYCRSLETFFNQNFPKNYYFCPVNLDERCYREYEVLVTSITQIDAVPQTIILKNESEKLAGTAVVIGAVTNQSFWEQLACKEPVSEIPVYSGAKQVASVPASNVIKLVNLISGLNSSSVESEIGDAFTTITAGECLSNILFYMYGQTTCPHCSRQDDFFKQNFPNNYFYCPIDKYQECYNAASQFVSFLVNKGVPLNIATGVPQIMVVKNDTSSILAVVIGELEERSFWLQIACSTPSTKIPIYASTGSSGSIMAEIDVNTTNHSKLINNYVVFPTVPGEKFNSQILGIIVVFAVLAVTIGGYTIYVRVHKRAEKQTTGKRSARKAT